jgi:hypothetical protein
MDVLARSSFRQTPFEKLLLLARQILGLWRFGGKQMIDKLRKFFEFDDDRSLKGLLLQMKMGSTEERILAEELIVAHSVRTREVIEAMIECVDCLQYRNEYSESKIEEALATLREKLGE